MEPNETSVPPKRGRKYKDPALRKIYKRKPLSLRDDQWDNLDKLAFRLHAYSRSGVNRGKPSWRTLIAMIAENAPQIIGIFDVMETLDGEAPKGA